jgi:hypothetical protein
MEWSGVVEWSGVELWSGVKAAITILNSGEKIWNFKYTDP